MNAPVRGALIRHSAPLLSIDLSVAYARRATVLRDVRLEVLQGETVGLVGESGSGKTTLAMALLGLLDYAGAKVSGRVSLLGEELVGIGERRMRAIRGRLMSLIPQSPIAALNPAVRIGEQLKEAWRAHSRVPWQAERRRFDELFRAAGLPSDGDFLRRFPRQISVGQGQRVLIVMALLHEPALLIADEPTSSLDVVTRAEVLELLARVQQARKMGTLFISHDLAAAAQLCSRIAVLHDGRIVESGTVSEVLGNPQAAYTRLLASTMGNRIAQYLG